MIPLKTIHTHEKIVGIRNITADAEELHKIMKLAVYITTDLYHFVSKCSPMDLVIENTNRDRRIDPDYIALLY